MRHKPPPPSFPDPTQNKQTGFTAADFTSQHHKKKAKPKGQVRPESPKETKRTCKTSKNSQEKDANPGGKRKRQKNGFFTLPRRPRSPKPLHPPPRHHLPNPTVPALASRAATPSRRNPDPLPCKRRQPAFDADSAGRASCECDGGKRSVLEGVEGASGG